MFVCTLFLFFYVVFVRSEISLCELPSCELVLNSRVYSERCQTAQEQWPLLVTATPRSATVFMQRTLQEHGMKIQHDWSAPLEHGSASWIFAFEDANNFGPARTNGKKFGHVFHQLRDPIKGLSSMCTEPVFAYSPKGFLEKHINFTSSHETPTNMPRGILQFWVEWHTFLRDMRFPAYQVESVDIETIFKYSGLHSIYNPNGDTPVKKQASASADTNHRNRRDDFSWNELYTADPHYAKRVWDMAAFYGYKYDVKFEDLTCLEAIPVCKGTSPGPSPYCPPGTHPTSDAPAPAPNVDPSVGISGIKGWIDGGCVEYKRSDGSFVGLMTIAANDEIITDELIDYLVAQRDNIPVQGPPPVTHPVEASEPAPVIEEPAKEESETDTMNDNVKEETPPPTDEEITTAVEEAKDNKAKRDAEQDAEAEQKARDDIKLPAIHIPDIKIVDTDKFVTPEDIDNPDFPYIEDLQEAEDERDLMTPLSILFILLAVGTVSYVMKQRRHKPIVANLLPSMELPTAASERSLLEAGSSSDEEVCAQRQY